MVSKYCPTLVAHSINDWYSLVVANDIIHYVTIYFSWILLCVIIFIDSDFINIIVTNRDIMWAEEMSRASSRLRRLSLQSKYVTDNDYLRQLDGGKSMAEKNQWFFEVAWEVANQGTLYILATRYAMWRRSWSFADYWKHFVAHLNGIIIIIIL